MEKQEQTVEPNPKRRKNDDDPFAKKQTESELNDKHYAGFSDGNTSKGTFSFGSLSAPPKNLIFGSPTAPPFAPSLITPAAFGSSFGHTSSPFISPTYKAPSNASIPLNQVQYIARTKKDSNKIRIEFNGDSVFIRKGDDSININNPESLDIWFDDDGVHYDINNGDF